MKQSGLVTVHRYDFPEGWALQPHRHEPIELTYIVEGEGALIASDGSVFPLREGSLALIASWERHSCTTRGKVSMLVMTFKPELASDYIRSASSSLLGKHEIRVLQLNAMQGAEYKRVFGTLVKENLSSGLHKQDAIRIGFESLLLLLSRSEQAEGIKANIYTCIQDAAREMEGQFHSEFRIQAFADKYYLSESYFRHKFKEVMGVSPKQYLQNLRLYTAERLLASTAYNVSRIAQEAGFCSVHQFNTLFQEKHGVMPNVWRRQYAQESVM